MKVIVNKTCATVSGAEMLTSGMVGKTINVEFSADWLGLVKIAVFTNGAVTRDVLDPNGMVIIPWEVLTTPNKRASVGFYGYKIENGEKVLAIPTIWAELGAVRAGADPSGDPSAELSPTVAEQLQADVNDLDERVTELEQGGGSGFDIHSLTAENELADGDEMPFYDVSKNAPRKTTWSNLKAKLKSYFDTLYLEATALVGYATQLWVQQQGYGTYSKPSGGIPKTDLASAVQTSLGLADSALQEHQSLADYSTTAQMNAAISAHHDSAKQDVISDLATIRSGAALGATALQNVPNTYRTAAAQDAIDNGKVDKVSGKGLSSNDFTNSDKNDIATALYALDELDMNKVNKAQGVAHAGEFLVVGSDGNVTTKTLEAWQGGSY